MPKPLADNTGSVMLFTLMFILIITVMGLIATQTSVFEIRITENARRYSEEFARAEAALNEAIANFRNLPAAGPYAIERVLNDSMYGDLMEAVYINDSPVIDPGTSISTARIEIRRISPDSLPACDGPSGNPAICAMTKQGMTCPRVNHRYYAGSIDKRRFAVTATAYRRNTKTLSATWVQKGISLPVEQDSDLF